MRENKIRPSVKAMTHSKLWVLKKREKAETMRKRHLRHDLQGKISKWDFTKLNSSHLWKTERMKRSQRLGENICQHRAE